MNKVKSKNGASEMSVLGSGIARGGTGGGRPPPRIFAKDREQPMPQPAMRIDSRRKFKFSFNVLVIYYNFL